MNEYLCALHLTFLPLSLQLPQLSLFGAVLPRIKHQYSKYNVRSTVKIGNSISYSFSALLYPTAKSHLIFKNYSRLSGFPPKFSWNFLVCIVWIQVPFCCVLSTFHFSFPFCFLGFNTVSNLMILANMRIISVSTSSILSVRRILTLIAADLLWKQFVVFGSLGWLFSTQQGVNPSQLQLILKADISVIDIQVFP